MEQESRRGDLVQVVGCLAFVFLELYIWRAVAQIFCSRYLNQSLFHRACSYDQSQAKSAFFRNCGKNGFKVKELKHWSFYWVNCLRIKETQDGNRIFQITGCFTSWLCPDYRIEIRGQSRLVAYVRATMFQFINVSEFSYKVSHLKHYFVLLGRRNHRR